jgi:hypothetical protein
MATSQAFRNALHVPLIDPTGGNVIAVQDPGGDHYFTDWSTASGLPEAPEDGQQYVRQDAAWQPVALAPLDILNSIKTVDGAGSGLDADFLDGISSAGFAASVHTHAQADITNLLTDQAAQNSAIALKAPIDSPVLTGDPRAPTPATTDNDTSIATTSYVQAAIAASIIDAGTY